MSDTYYALPAGFREQVSDIFYQSVQQNDSKFGNCGVIQSDWVQTQYTFRITAPLAFVETTGQRGGDTQQGEYLVGYRSGFIRDFECAVDFDINDRDRLYSANRPDSEAQRDLVSAWNRSMDDIFVDAAQALSYGGVKPYITPAASLPTLMTIPVTWATIANGATNTNFTIWKIEEALQRMATQNVDLDREMVTIAIPPKVRQAWLVYAMSAPNSAFAQMFMPWFQDKKGETRFMGCEMIVSNRLETTGSVTNCLIFAKSAFRLSPPKFDMRIDIRTDKRHATQIVVYAKRGCMRLYDEKVNIAYSDTSVAITF
jgi:hypothetical protein